jgi:hypothetical protein
MKYIVLAADVTPRETKIEIPRDLMVGVAPVSSFECDITVRYFDLDRWQVVIVDFLQQMGKTPRLYRYQYERPTKDDERFVTQIMEHKIKVVNTEGNSDEPPG